MASALETKPSAPEVSSPRRSRFRLRGLAFQCDRRGARRRPRALHAFRAQHQLPAEPDVLAGRGVGRGLDPGAAAPGSSRHVGDPARLDAAAARFAIRRPAGFTPAAIGLFGVFRWRSRTSSDAACRGFALVAPGGRRPHVARCAAGPLVARAQRPEALHRRCFRHPLRPAARRAARGAVDPQAARGAGRCVRRRLHDQHRRALRDGGRVRLAARRRAGTPQLAAGGRGGRRRDRHGDRARRDLHPRLPVARAEEPDPVLEGLYPPISKGIGPDPALPALPPATRWRPLRGGSADGRAHPGRRRGDHDRALGPAFTGLRDTDPAAGNDGRRARRRSTRSSISARPTS